MDGSTATTTYRGWFQAGSYLGTHSNLAIFQAHLSGEPGGEATVHPERYIEGEDPGHDVYSASMLLSTSGGAS